MFKELSPLLRQRSVLITLTRRDDDKILVNIMPKKLAESENEALTTPVTLCATGEELDDLLPSALVRFVGAHLALSNTIDSAEAEMAAAAKVAKAQAKTKSNTPVKAGSAAVVTNKPANQAPKPESDAPKPALEKMPIVPRTASLFGMPETPSPAVPVPSPHVDDAAEEEDQILAEIGDATQDGDSLEPAA